MEVHASSSRDNRKIDANSRKLSKANKDTEITEKEKLLQDIQKLRSIIKNCEFKLNTLCFKDVEERVINLQGSQRISPRFSRIPNVEIDLKYDLYKFAGLHCVKFRKDEIVFNFTSTNKQQKDTYAVQIFSKGGKYSLGKWVMPMSIDMNDIWAKTPINNVKDIIALMKNCKRKIAVYDERHKQFLSLKDHTMHIKHCILNANIGYTQIQLELHGVNDIKNNNYLNLLICLLYLSDEARPYTIKVDTLYQNKLDDDTIQKLKVCLKEFKKTDLTTAFDKVMTENNSEFVWMRRDDSDSPLELNDTSDSDEGFLAELQSHLKKVVRRRKKKHELQKKWKGRKRQKDTSLSYLKKYPSKKIVLSKDNEGHHTASVTHTKDSYQFPMESPMDENAVKIKSTSKQQKNVNENLLKEITPKQPKVRLRQTKLNFQVNQNSQQSSANINKSPLLKSKLRNKPGDKITKLVTSTPLNRGIRRTSLSSSLELDLELEFVNITNNEIRSKHANEVNDSRNSSPSKNKNTPEKRNSSRLLRSNTRLSESSLRSHIEAGQCFTRSMTRLRKRK